MSCLNISPDNTQLMNLCKCQSGMDALTDAIKLYEKQVEDAAIAEAKWNADFNIYQQNMQKWNTARQNNRNNLANEQHEMQCGEDCYPDWNELRYSVCGFGYHKRVCQRNSTAVDRDEGSWLKSNPKPTDLRPKPVFNISAPSGNNIQCCSQLFQGNTADNINFSNISQNCQQKISQDIIVASNIIPQTPTETPSTTPEVVNNSFLSKLSFSMIILIGFMIFILFFAIIIIIIL